MSCLPVVAAAQEIEPFRLSSVEGFLALRYLEDEERSGAPSTGKFRDGLRVTEQELFVLTRSSVYHPNFLTVDFGLGPLFVQNKAVSGDLSNSDSEALYNLTAHLNFFDPKSYPFKLYYEHLNPTVTTSVSQSIVTESTRQGANFTLREPLSPVLVNVDAYELQTKGEGITDRIDDTIRQGTLRLGRAIGSDGYNEFSLSRTEQDSRSGNLTLPITPTFSDTSTATLDTRARFGERRQAYFTSYLTGSEQTIDTDTTRLYERRDLRWSPDLRWDHTQTLSSFYRYNLFDATEQGRDTTIQSVTAGVNYLPEEDVTASFDARAEHNKTTGFTADVRGVNGRLRYRVPIDEQNAFEFNVGLGYDYRDQESPTDRVDISNESVQLNGVTPVFLSQDFIDVNTIRVFNTTRTQEYCRLTPVPQPVGCTAADYTVIVIGAKTQIVRVVSGAITDGQTVVVDYTFQTGGSVAYSTFAQNYRATLFFLRYFQAFARYLNTQHTVSSGQPTVPLNDISSILVGARADYPFWFDWMVGGEVNLERQHETISPFDRQSYDAYVQMMLPLASSLRLNIRRVIVDYSTSTEDVDLRGYGAAWRARPWSRTVLTLETTYDEDRGGSLPREYLNHVLGFEWRYRQVGLRAEARYTRETQLDFERDRTIVRVVAQRNF